MTYSFRIFIIGQDETLYRLASTTFSGMLDDPSDHLMPSFAGQRVRMAEAVVELRDRRPLRVVRLVYEILRFDEQGRLDVETFGQQNVALLDVMLESTLKNETNNTAIIDASSRFVAQGGRWHPSPSLERRVYQAALDEVKYQRL
ncbi:MAG: hypothetical protein Q7U78_13445 [Gallionella sp.]|nr:hypothetical protein [Gallionella sp.]